MAVELITDSEFDAAIAANPKIVVKYFADWCGNCKMVAPKYKRLSDDERFKDVKFLDVNAELNPNARKLAGVTNLPFFATFVDGKVVEAKATSKEEAIVELLNKII